MSEEILNKDNLEEQENDNLNEEALEKEADFHDSSSYTLQNIPENFLPDRRIVCQTCPNAMWMFLEGKLQCWCKETAAFTFVTNQSKKMNILLCDGPFQEQEENE